MGNLPPVYLPMIGRKALFTRVEQRVQLKLRATSGGGLNSVECQRAACAAAGERAKRSTSI